MKLIGLLSLQPSPEKNNGNIDGRGYILCPAARIQAGMPSKKKHIGEEIEKIIGDRNKENFHDPSETSGDTSTPSSFPLEHDAKTGVIRHPCDLIRI